MGMGLFTRAWAACDAHTLKEESLPLLQQLTAVNSNCGGGGWPRTPCPSMLEFCLAWPWAQKPQMWLLVPECLSVAEIPYL